MPCCGAEPAGAPAILTQRAARGKSGRLWRRSSRVCRRRLMSGNLSLPSGKVFSQQAERRGIAAARCSAPRTPKTRETSILTKTTIHGVDLPRSRGLKVGYPSAALGSAPFVARRVVIITAAAPRSMPRAS